MICENCGTYMPDDAKFCSKCGADLKEKPSAMFCTNCGSQLADGARFCTNCGAVVGTSPAAGQNQPTRIVITPKTNTRKAASGSQKPKKKRFLIGGLAMVCLLVLVGVLMRFSGGKTGNAMGDKVLNAPLPSVDQMKRWADAEDLMYSADNEGARFELDNTTPTKLLGETCLLTFRISRDRMITTLFVAFKSDKDRKNYKEKLDKYLSGKMPEGTKKGSWDGASSYVTDRFRKGGSVYYKVVLYKFDSGTDLDEIDEMTPDDGKDYIKSGILIGINYLDGKELEYYTGIPVPKEDEQYTTEAPTYGDESTAAIYGETTTAARN